MLTVYYINILFLFYMMYGSGVNEKYIVLRERIVVKYNANNTALQNTELFNTVINKMSLLGGEIVIDGGEYKINSLLMPKNIQLTFVNNAALNISSLDSMLINGIIYSSQPNQIFRGNGSVIFTNEYKGSVHASWFGALGDGRNDNTQQIQKAINSVRLYGGNVLVTNGTFIVDSIIIFENIVLEGKGKQKTIIKRKHRQGAGGVCIKIIGSNASLKNISIEGKWDPKVPIIKTYDINVSIHGNNVSHVIIDNVESYNAHIGFLMGGFIGREGFTGQDSAKYLNCYSHDTYDNNYSLVASDSVNVNVGTLIKNCVGKNSFSSANYEIRFQEYSSIINCSASNAKDKLLGAGIRFEETRNISISNFSAEECNYGVQFIHNSRNITLTNLSLSKNTTGILLRSTQDILLKNINITDSQLYGIRFDTEAGWSFYNYNVSIINTAVIRSGNTGIIVVGKGELQHDALNSSNLFMENIFINVSSVSGIFIKAGQNINIVNSVIQDSNTGILLENPEIKGNKILNLPNGAIHNITFISNGRQSTPIRYVDNDSMKTKIVATSLKYINSIK